ncbi:Panacea domain-containing protein [Paenibacillus sp. Root444D2]|uniref:Panacea domain-containing protein n=1 Tax=Paenibacillus sp. Root444D2 TaxID=1736538 RepID=UPI00070E6FDC|nr:Panacea domain-containing protein [Paenibacillus sp. Root444D2]KQX69213.1 hypothetical protein ASD40_01565 [Paenibacillus sp. Root444D2]
MTDIRHILRYFAIHYPYKNELSKTRITKMVYLADWFSSQRHHKQMTKIKWYFDHYGPYVSDVYDAAKKDNKLKIVEEFSAYGSPKLLIALKSKDSLGLEELDKKETKILDKVIEETKTLNWSEFIDYVYSTYPIKNKARYNFLNLAEMAKDEEIEN